MINVQIVSKVQSFSQDNNKSKDKKVETIFLQNDVLFDVHSSLKDIYDMINGFKIGIYWINRMIDITREYEFMKKDFQMTYKYKRLH